MSDCAVSIIIVSWNVRDTLRKNMERLFSLSTKERFEVIVIDNGSSDKTAEMIRTNFPQVHIIQNDENRGFAFACNQGLRAARGEVMILFNPDMLMGEDVIDRAYKTLKERVDIGVLGVRLLREDGTIVESVRRDPRLWDQLAILLKLPHLFPSVVSGYLMKDFDYGTSQEVPQVRGSFFAFRRDVMDVVGLLDADRFFVWFEEVDFCRRVREAGYKIWYRADISCTDLVGQAFKQQPIWLKQARMCKSMARYFMKWYSVASSLIVWAMFPFVVMLGAVLDALRLKSRRWK